MRRLDSNEIAALNSDLVPFENFLKLNGLLSEKVRDKYNGISFYAETKEQLGGANGKARINSESGKRDIIILDSAFNNDRSRSRFVYHELGHGLMGMTSYKKAELLEKVLKPIGRTMEKYPSDLTERNTTYVSGCSLLEEWLVERFSIFLQEQCKRIRAPERKYRSCPTVCSNYKYWSTTENKYGIFESICDELCTKTFGDLSTAIKLGLQEEFFESFFDRFDEKEIMTILGNLGKVYQAIMINAGYSRTQHATYSPDEIEKILLETRKLVSDIKPKVQEMDSIR